MLKNIYRVQQIWENEPCAEPAIVIANNEASAKVIASENDKDDARRPHWASAEVEMLGWCTGEPEEGIVCFGQLE